MAPMQQHTQWIQRITLATAIIFAALLTLYALYSVWEVLVLFFVAFIMASALRPTVLRIERKYGVTRSLVAMGLQLALFTVFIAFTALVIPPFMQESQQLAETARKMIDLPEFQWELLLSQDIEQVVKTMEALESVVSRFGQSLTGLVSVLSSALTTVIVAVTLFVVMYYFIVSFDHLARSIAWILPGTKAEKLARAEKILTNVSSELGSWIRARLIVMVLIGITTYIGLSILGIPYALPLAIAATLLEIIPNIGPILAAVPAILLAFFLSGPTMALAVVVFYTAVQQLESNFLTPQVMKKVVDVHPITTLFLVMAGLHVMGMAGGLLVLPMYVAIRSVVQELWPDKGPLQSL